MTSGGATSLRSVGGGATSLRSGGGGATSLRSAGFGAALLVVLVLPPCTRALESQLLLQQLVQVPLLALSGWAMGRRLADFNPHWNADGLPGLIVAVGVASFWMLPRAMDAALASLPFEIAKLASLPLGVGIPLALSWPRASSLVRTFLLANAISMAALVGWLYLAAPLRVCNFYLRDDQEWTGIALLSLSAVVALSCALRCFLGDPSREALAPARLPTGHRVD